MDELDQLKADLAKFQARDQVNEGRMFKSAGDMARNMLQDIRSLKNEIEEGMIDDIADAKFEIDEIVDTYLNAQVRGR